MINLDRLKLAREAHTSNCVGTALYLFGITDSDMTINLHKSYKNHLKLATFCNASDLEKIDSPEEDCLAIFVPAIASYGLNAGVTHAGIITAQQKSLGKWGLSSYIYQELKEMCQWSTFKRNRYGSREDFYKRMKEKREIIAKV
ncbi:MAG: hypothetical protein Q8L27_02415, partial [archaeon]|nr:hypothetical protein [archaeon]